MDIHETLKPDESDPLRAPEQVAEELLGAGAVKCRATYLRWVTDGLRVPGSGGRVVKLPAIRVGYNLRTSKRAMLAFLAAMNPETLTPPPSDSGRSPAKRRRDSEAAALQLSEMGV